MSKKQEVCEFCGLDSEHCCANRKCWRCGALSSPPTPQYWVGALEIFQAGQSDYFRWPKSEIERLRNTLQQGDIITQMFAGSVRILHKDGTETEFINRGDGT
jgi:hypothetical protein